MSKKKIDSTVLRKDRTYIMIKKRMKEFHSCLDRSLKHRKMLDSYKVGTDEYKMYFEKVVESEIRCIELDEIIWRLYNEYLFI